MEEVYYLTREGLKKIKEEYEELKKKREEKIKEGSPPILHSEDLNPQYMVFKEDMFFLETRLKELEKVLKNYQLIVPPKGEKRKTVQIGAIVTLQENGGAINEFMVVDSIEANPSEGKISWRSPLGKLLLNKKVGEKVFLTTPTKIIYTIKKIRYET